MGGHTNSDATLDDAGVKEYDGSIHISKDPVMAPASTRLEISDVAIWFKHVHAPSLAKRLYGLQPEEEVTLEADGVVGRWQRMKTGKDGREVVGIRPVGAMKSVWGNWFKNRKGELIDVREVAVADDYLAATAPLFSEWASPEDEEAFRDL